MNSGDGSLGCGKNSITPVALAGLQGKPLNLGAD
jgi:hypothetical protein